jgi:hypothetical protein
LLLPLSSGSLSLPVPAPSLLPCLASLRVS